MRLMRMTLAILACLITGAYAGMIEYTDDDQLQEFEFSNCNPDSIQGVIVGVRIDGESLFVETLYALTDTVSSIDFRYIAGDVDSHNRRMPGHREGGYSVYFVPIPRYEQPVAAEDTLHFWVSYDVRSGCGGNPLVD